MKFVQGLPMTSRTQTVQSPSKVGLFYKQIVEAPLNYGSLQRRSCGKSTLIRQVAFGKRCILSMRGMIVPDASLRPNQIQLPAHVVKKFNIQNQWIILNRMPSLQPGNFIALKVSSPGWEYDCFGIPLEVVQAMNADFDGDECNLYLVPNALSQAECATILNPESQLGCFVMQGPKLTPTQDMLVGYFAKFNDIHFLPYKHSDLSKTFQVLYDCYGSQQTFEYIDQMRQFYLNVFQRQMCFALTLQEIQTLYEWGRESLEKFQQKAETSQGCLVTQVLSGAKGTFEHLYQMFGSIGYQNDVFVKHSFWEGLSANEP
ncbi:RPOLA_N domain-containing protein [Trichonephila clavata]|uniref:DNA-directed RNA polymerase n=1 Tax=Trichonephila clavata TaxID=2740835 RepID=A0A8X6I2B9_TRICU|nr:RPOLA_N domain-containing protein [Trichonephila clavata]